MALINIMIKALILMLSTEMVKSTTSKTVDQQKLAIAIENDSSTTFLIEQQFYATNTTSLIVYPSYSSISYFSSTAQTLSRVSTDSLSNSFSSPNTNIDSSTTAVTHSESSTVTENYSSTTILTEQSTKATDASSPIVHSSYSSTSYFTSEAQTLSRVSTDSLSNSFISIITNINSSTQLEQLLSTLTTEIRQSDSFSVNENAYSSLFSIQAAGVTYSSLNPKTLLHSSISLVYSSSFNSFSIFSTKIPVPVEVIYDFRIAIKMEFNDYLKNPSSNDYIKLEDIVVKQLTAIFRNIEGFIKVLVIGFEKGSVRINSRVFFDKNEAKASDSVLQGKVINNFMQHLNSSNGTVGGFLVDAKSVSIERTVDVRSSSVANWIIVMIVALILLLALSVVILLQRRKIRDFKDRLYVSEHISAGSFSPYDNPNFELVQVRKISTKDMKKESEILKNSNEHEAVSKSLFYGDINGVNVENKKPSDKDVSVSKKYINGAYISDD